MRNPLDVFNQNVNCFQTLEVFYDYFNQNAKDVDASDILRAEFVLIVSAFDCYIHDLVKKGMVEIFNGTRVSNKNYENYTLSMSQIKNVLDQDAVLRSDTLGGAISDINSKDSYQAPKSIEYALGLISYNNIWTQLSPILGLTPETIKNRIAVIVRRRNQIAHEADLQSTISEERNAICLSDVQGVSSFLKQLVNGIDSLY